MVYFMASKSTSKKRVQVPQSCSGLQSEGNSYLVIDNLRYEMATEEETIILKTTFSSVILDSDMVFIFICLQCIPL